MNANASHSTHEFTAYELAQGEALIRQLRWRIMFAQSEPKFLPPEEDPDTGKIAPVPHDGPRLKAQRIANLISCDAAAMHILKRYGWTKNDHDSNLETMLSHLPPSNAVLANSQ